MNVYSLAVLRRLLWDRVRLLIRARPYRSDVVYTFIRMFRMSMASETSFSDLFSGHPWQMDVYVQTILLEETQKSLDPNLVKSIIVLDDDSDTEGVDMECDESMASDGPSTPPTLFVDLGISAVCPPAPARTLRREPEFTFARMLDFEDVEDFDVSKAAAVAKARRASMYAGGSRLACMSPPPISVDWKSSPACPPAPKRPVVKRTTKRGVESSFSRLLNFSDAEDSDEDSDVVDVTDMMMERKRKRESVVESLRQKAGLKTDLPAPGYRRTETSKVSSGSEAEDTACDSDSDTDSVSSLDTSAASDDDLPDGDWTLNFADSLLELGELRDLLQYVKGVERKRAKSEYKSLKIHVAALSAARPAHEKNYCCAECQDVGEDKSGLCEFCMCLSCGTRKTYFDTPCTTCG